MAFITLDKIGYFDQNGSGPFTVDTEVVRVQLDNIGDIETHTSGAILMFRNAQKLDQGIVTGFLVSQTPAQIDTLIATVSSTLAALDGTVGAPSISFASDTDTGGYRIGANNMGIAAAGAKVLDIGTSGLGVTGGITATTTIAASGVVSGVGSTSTGINKHAGTPQTLTGAGAVNLTTHTTLIVSTGADAGTLAAGAEGQYKFVKMKTDGGDHTLTVTNLQGGTTITFNDAGDFVFLFYVDSKWNILTNSGCTVA